MNTASPAYKNMSQASSEGDLGRRSSSHHPGGSTPAAESSSNACSDRHDESDEDEEDAATHIADDWRRESWFDGDNVAALASKAAAHNMVKLSTKRPNAGMWLARQQQLALPVAPVVRIEEAELFIETIPAFMDERTLKVNFEEFAGAYNKCATELAQRDTSSTSRVRYKTPAFLKMYYDVLAQRLATEMSMRPVQGLIRDFNRALKTRSISASVPEAMPLPSSVLSPRDAEQSQPVDMDSTMNIDEQQQQQQLSIKRPSHLQQRQQEQSQPTTKPRDPTGSGRGQRRNPPTCKRCGEVKTAATGHQLKSDYCPHPQLPPQPRRSGGRNYGFDANPGMVLPNTQYSDCSQ